MIPNNLRLQKIFFTSLGDLVPDEFPTERTKLAEELWKTFLKQNTPMDISHYNALLRVYLENGHNFSTEEFLKDLEAKGLEPNRYLIYHEYFH